jgi:hypothetical protein
MAPGQADPLVSFCQARLALYERQPDRARALLEPCLDLFQKMGEKSGIAHCHLNLGRAAQLEGAHETARAEYAAALPVFGKMHDRWAVALGLEAFAGLAADEGDAARAARLFGAADALRERIGAPRPPVEQPEYERQIAALRAVLGEPAWAVALAEGRALPPERAISEALQSSA